MPAREQRKPASRSSLPPTSPASPARTTHPSNPSQPTSPTRSVPTRRAPLVPVAPPPTRTQPAAPQPLPVPSAPPTAPRNPGSRSTTMHYLVPPSKPASGPSNPPNPGPTHPGQPPPPQPGQLPQGEPMSRTLQLALQESHQIAPTRFPASTQPPGPRSVAQVPQSALFPDGSANFADDSDDDDFGEEEEGQEGARRIRDDGVQPVGGGVSLDGIDESTKLSDLTDAQILALTQSLKDHTASQRPLISPVEPLQHLEEEYEGGSATVVRKLRWLEGKGWRGVRRTRGDGDCFYRSLAFSYVERLLLAPDPALAVAMSLSTLQDGRHLLDEAGFQELVYEDFYDVLVSLISSIISPPSPGQPLLSGPALLSAFQDAETSNSIVVYLRLLTSAYIRAHEPDFLPYLFSPETGDLLDVRDFCEREVEASGKEADHVQEMALTKALRLRVRIAYLDASSHGGSAGVREGEEKVDFVEFESEEAGGVGEMGNGMHEIALLYRPGHFDVLETRDRE